MAGGSDDQCFIVPRAFFSEAGCGIVMTEINQHVRILDYISQIIACFNLANDLDVRNAFGATKQRQSHPPFRTSDDYFYCHKLCA